MDKSDSAIEWHLFSLSSDHTVCQQKNCNITSDKDLMPAKGYLRTLIKLFYRLPSGIRVLIMEYILRSPFRAKGVIGTVGFATVNMTGRLSGWVFPDKNPYSIYIALGSVTQKPLVINGAIQIRDVLNVTAIFDHNVIGTGCG